MFSDIPLSSWTVNQNPLSYNFLLVNMFSPSFLLHVIIFISLPLILYSYGVEVSHFLWIFTQSVGLLGRVIGLSQGLYINTEKRTHTPNIHALGGTRTHDHSDRASDDSSLFRLLGYYDRLHVIISVILLTWNYPTCFIWECNSCYWSENTHFAPSQLAEFSVVVKPFGLSYIIFQLSLSSNC
jgi:hypothetical protein